jgi:type II secretory pathway component PulK
METHPFRQGHRRDRASCNEGARQQAVFDALYLGVHAARRLIGSEDRRQDTAKNKCDGEKRTGFLHGGRLPMKKRDGVGSLALNTTVAKMSTRKFAIGDGCYDEVRAVIQLQK